MRFYSQTQLLTISPRKVQFHVAEVCSDILNLYAQESDPVQLPQQQLSPTFKFKAKDSLNCYSFGAGYETEDKLPLVPGALPNEDKTHPVGWMADKSLRDQGLVRVDSMLCSNFDFTFLENTAAPFYLIAVIHSGKEIGAPDAHVMRCFYDKSNDRLVWLQSGGTKEVTLVQNSSQLVTGIPVNPVGMFCNEHYPCFLGYYLVTDSVNLLSPKGSPAHYLE